MVKFHEIGSPRGVIPLRLAFGGQVQYHSLESSFVILFAGRTREETMGRLLRGIGSVLDIGGSTDYDVLFPLRTVNERAAHCLVRMADRLRHSAYELEQSEAKRIRSTRQENHPQP